MIILTRDQIVAEARSWIDTPFVHQGRRKAIGVDCVGVIIGVANALRISSFDTADYSASPNPETMGARLRENLDEIPFREVLPGDILWFRVTYAPQHLGIVSEVAPELCMVHAYSRQPVTKCIEQPLGKMWTARIRGCFRYRDVVWLR